MVKHARSKRAFLLNDAWWYFAPKILKDELEKMHKLPKRTYSTEVSDDQAKNFQNLIQAAHGLVEELFIAKPPVRKMVEHLLQQLRTDKLEAWGVKIKPELGPSPQKLPAFLFKGHPTINWVKGTVEHLGQRFEIVEVSRPNKTPEILQRPAASTRKRLGRPRVDEEIAEVVRELIKQHKFARITSEKEIVGLVQSHCQDKFPKRFRKNTQPSPTKIRQILKSFDI